MKIDIRNSFLDRFTSYSRSNFTYSNKANIYIFAIYAIRTLYGLFLIDPHSGQDAPSYFEDAEIVLKNGPFAQVLHAPIWPIGYTWFLSLIWKIGGLDSRLLGLTQSTLVLVATFALYHLVKREIGREIALISSLLMSSSFAIFVSAGEIMYETSMMSFFLIGLNLISKFSLDGSSSRRTVFLGGLFFGLAILIHPSILGPVFICLAIVFIRILKRRSDWVVLALMLLIIASGPALNTARNYISGDGFGYTGNIYTISTFSGWGSGSPEKLEDCKKKGVRITSLKFKDKLEYYDSSPRQVCLYKVALENPKASFEIVVRNGLRFVSPYIGVMKSNGTWYHGLDVRRLVPQYVWWDGGGRVLDTVLCAIWILTHLTMMIFGCVLLLRKKAFFRLADSYSAYLFIFPVIIKWTTSMFTHGDSRHRIAISPIYLTLVSVAIYFILKKTQMKFVENRLS